MAANQKLTLTAEDAEDADTLRVLCGESYARDQAKPNDAPGSDVGKQCGTKKGLPKQP